MGRLPQSSGRCSDQPSCGRETFSGERVPMIFCLSSSLCADGRSLKSSPRYMGLLSRKIVAHEDIDADVFHRLDQVRSALAISTRTALRTSWPAFWLMITSMVPSTRARRV